MSAMRGLLGVFGTMQSALRFRPPVIVGEPQVSVYVQFIDPMMAERMLRNQIRNRKKRPGRMEYLARCMRRKEYVFTGDTIKLTADGMLLDGQHRLEAVCMTGIGQWFVVVRGIDQDVFPFLDSVAPRKTADALETAEIEEASRLPQVIRLALAYGAWCRGGPLAIGMNGGRSAPTTGGTTINGRSSPVRISPWQEAGLVDQLPGIVDAAKKITSMKGLWNGVVSHHALTFFWWGASQHDRDAADRFISSILTMVDFSEVSPARATRVALDRHRRDCASHRSQPDMRIELQLLIRGWNAFITCVDMKSLNIPTSGKPALFVMPINVPQIETTGNSKDETTAERSARQNRLRLLDDEEASETNE